MNQQCRAAVLTKIGSIEIDTFPLPDINDYDAILKIEMAGVCGTDPNIFAGKVKYSDPPLILGHEIIGNIHKIGDIASKRWNVAEGDRVVVESTIRCGFCSNCISGNYRFCEEKMVYGCMIPCTRPPYLWGAYADFLYLPPGAVVHKIPDTVPAKAGVLINAVIADAIRWGRDIGDFFPGRSVVIQGVGQQGLALVMVAKECGCYPIIVTGLSSDSERFILAKQFGADYTVAVDSDTSDNEDNAIDIVSQLTKGLMADVVVNVSGSAYAGKTSPSFVKKSGVVVMASLVGNDVITELDMDKIVHNEITIRGVFTTDADYMASAIRLVDSGKYPMEDIVTHTFSLEDAENAVLSAGGYINGVNPIKCVIVP